MCLSLGYFPLKRNSCVCVSIQNKEYILEIVIVIVIEDWIIF